MATHNLNCAKLIPGDMGPLPCSCGAEKDSWILRPYTGAVHNHGPAEGAGLDCREFTVNGKMVGACISGYHHLRDGGDEGPQPGDGPEYHTDRAAWEASRKAATAPPVDSEDLGATLTRWWVSKARGEAEELVPKAVEYGGAHRASDLTQLGRTIAELMKFTPDERRLRGLDTDGFLQELACYFYLQGKMGRWQAALLEGRKVSDDTIHDIKIYTTMVQRIRESGGWPV